MIAVLFSCETVEVIYDYRQQLQEEQGIIDQYLLDNNIEGLIDPSGLRYQILEAGGDTLAREGDRVTFEATVQRLDGQNLEVYDNTSAQELTLVWGLVVRNLINDNHWQCFHEAAKHIGKEGRIRMYVPSVLANRERRDLVWGTINGNSSGAWIPGNTPLIIETFFTEIERR